LSCNHSRLWNSQKTVTVKANAQTLLIHSNPSDSQLSAILHLYILLSRGRVVGWGTMLQAGRSRVRIPIRWIFNWPNPSSRTMVLGSTSL
jgi:hypothetical protein